jgi:hypothetical protein
MQLGVQYPNLQQMFGQDSLYGTLYGMDQFKAAQANDVQNLSQAQQDQSFQAQRQPLDLASLTANTEHTQALANQANAQTPGMAADSNMKIRKDQTDASIPMDTRRKAAISQLASQMSDDDVKIAEDHIKANMVSPDPNVRAEAAALFPHLQAVAAEQLKLKTQGDNDARVANIHASASRDVAQTAADTQLKVANIKKEATLGSAKTAEAKGIYLEQKAQEAYADNDKEAGDAYMERANKMKQQAYEQKRAAAGENASTKVDITAATGMPTNPTPVVQPYARPGTSAPQTANPAVPAPNSIVDHGGVKYRYKGGKPSDPSSWEKL